MNSDRYLLKLGRISAWILLVFMVLFILSGYAWEERIIMPLQQARWIHTQLDTCLVFFFLVHALICAKFALRRWKVGHESLINGFLLIIEIVSFLFVLSI
jgi:thiosulfate reductase cytochrome b subunit